MTAISLYIATCRYMMQADANERDTWSELYRYLPFLRQALSCCVCGKIISRPKGPSHSECLHNVCTNCVGAKMRLKPSCSWCKDYVDFRDNIHLRILVLCYKKLCEYIHSTPIWEELCVTAPNGETNNLVAIINEAMSFEDDYVASTHLPNPHTTMPILTPATVKLGRKRIGSHRNKDQSADDISESLSQEPPTLSPETQPFDKESGKNLCDLNTGSVEGDDHSICTQTMSPPSHTDNKSIESARSRHISGRVLKSDKYQLEKNTDEVVLKSVKAKRSSRQETQVEPPSKRRRAASLPSGPEFSRKVCRCARNNPPNRLTCLGQRCPCYSSRMPCVGCMCRGCRNPRKFEDVTFELESGRMEVEQSSDLETE